VSTYCGSPILWSYCFSSMFDPRCSLQYILWLRILKSVIHWIKRIFLCFASMYTSNFLKLSFHSIKTKNCDLILYWMIHCIHNSSNTRLWFIVRWKGVFIPVRPRACSRARVQWESARCSRPWPQSVHGSFSRTSVQHSRMYRWCLSDACCSVNRY